MREAAASGPGTRTPVTEEWRKPDALGRVLNFAPEEGSYATTVMIPGKSNEKWIVPSV